MEDRIERLLSELVKSKARGKDPSLAIPYEDNGGSIRVWLCNNNVLPVCTESSAEGDKPKHCKP
eukprot:3688020-Amphidinium_carterae.2